MTVLTFPGRDFDADMRALAEAARRNTHLIVATNRRTGETLSRHARPHAEAVEYRDQWRKTFSGDWTVKVVPVRRWGR